VGAGPIAREVFKAAFPPGSFIRREKLELGSKMDEEIPLIQEDDSTDTDADEEVSP
jgi:hypothetical protein